MVWHFSRPRWLDLWLCCGSKAVAITISVPQWGTSHIFISLYIHWLIYTLIASWMQNRIESREFILPKCLLLYPSPTTREMVRIVNRIWYKLISKCRSKSDMTNTINYLIILTIMWYLFHVYSGLSLSYSFLYIFNDSCWTNSHLNPLHDLYGF